MVVAAQARQNVVEVPADQVLRGRCADQIHCRRRQLAVEDIGRARLFAVGISARGQNDKVGEAVAVHVAG